MYIDLRIYKRFDPDLLALYNAGYSVSKMAKDAMVAYATKRPFYIYIDQFVPINLEGKRSQRFRVKIGKNADAVSEVIQHVQIGYKSSFCKSVLRNALIRQNIISFYEPKTANNMISYNLPVQLEHFENVKLLSDYKSEKKKDMDPSTPKMNSIAVPSKNTINVQLQENVVTKKENTFRTFIKEENKIETIPATPQISEPIVNTMSQTPVQPNEIASGHIPEMVQTPFKIEPGVPITINGKTVIPIVMDPEKPDEMQYIPVQNPADTTTLKTKEHQKEIITAASNQPEDPTVDSIDQSSFEHTDMPTTDNYNEDMFNLFNSLRS